MKKIKALVIDDSALMRSLLTKGLSKDPEIEVVGAAVDPYEARDLIVKLRPDVLTLDVEMPRMNGVTFLRKLMAKMPIPTVMLSSLTERGARITLEALEAGAVDVLTKPANLVEGVPEMMDDIRRRVKAAASAKPQVRSSGAQAVAAVSETVLEDTTDKVIAIGASTGGVEAIARILPAFPSNAPGIVIVEHMPAGYTKAFAERLDKACSMKVQEAKKGDRIRSGLVLVAPGGDNHLRVERFGGQYRVDLVPSEGTERHVPAVDVLFESTAKAAGANAVGIILTGMGDDGARGMVAMRNKGARTFAQDEKSCVVFGMPKVALEMGGAERAVQLLEIPKVALEALGSVKKAKAS